MWSKLLAELPNAVEAVHLGLRLILAGLAGGVVGYDRQRRDKSAGVRTHVLVALGSATFVVATVAIGGSVDDLARVVQGTAAGIGFIGAGAIVQGLTTAAGVWMTAALGVAAGMGRLWLAAFATGVTWIVLEVVVRTERRAPGRAEPLD